MQPIVDRVNDKDNSDNYNSLAPIFIFSKCLYD